jgi:siroheme synthase-like protein
VTPYYPIYVDLRGRRCVVVGGGTVAARKVDGLLECGAEVTVVAPILGPVLKEYLRAGRIAAHLRAYADGDLAGACLAIAATDEPSVNGQVAAEARARGVLLNAADDPERCDFILPAVLRRGDLQIAISTGGRSPALARRVREDLERLLPPEYLELLPLLADLRAELRQEGAVVPPERWHDAVDETVLARLRDGDYAGARAYLRASLLVEPVVIPRTPLEA